ncbi:MAG: hypothetical protein Q7S90_05815 [Rubrivivax sp.]|nr:hypothetical protein [Rubrivivax sp.]
MNARSLPSGPTMAGPRWSTACFGDSTDTTPMELTALGEHVSLCRAAGGRFSGLRCGIDAVHGMVASRFVTTLILATVLIGAVLLAL